MVDEIVVGFEDAVGEPVVAHELPDVLDRVELWALRRQQNDGDIGRHEEARGQVPAGLVDQEDGVGSGRDGCGDLGEVEAVRWSRGALGRVPRLAQRRVILFFWPMRASSANQISIVSRSSAFLRAIASRRAGKFF